MLTLDSLDLVPRIIMSIPDILRTKNNGMEVFQPKPKFLIRFLPLKKCNVKWKMQGVMLKLKWKHLGLSCRS